MKQSLKRVLFGILGKDPEAVILILGTGRHAEIMRELVPDRRHIVIESCPGESAGEAWLRIRSAVSDYRVALGAVSTTDPALLTAALLALPNKVLAFNANLERHHIRWAQPIASFLFLRGVPLDRILLRPTWLWPFKKDLSVLPQSWRTIAGRAFREGKPRLAVLSPYLPWPLSHGGAVRIYNLLKQASGEFDIVLFGFEDGQTEDDYGKIAEFCSFIHAAAKPRYREPRWSTLLPPEACEFYSPGLHAELRRLMAGHGIQLLQVEYTQLARYGGAILVEHDVTWDLFEQIHRREQSLGSWWNLFRWRRFETSALKRYPAVVAMSEKDAGLLQLPDVTVIPNGVDLARFTSERPAPSSARLLFIGSFRHFPNVRAYQYFVDEIWPLIRRLDLAVTVVAGPDPQLYWPHPSPDPRIELLGFVRDVKPLYEDCSMVLIPTVVSAGTNLKALEAMAMDRPIVSTPSGVAGLGLEHGKSVLIAGSAADFADCIGRLIDDPALGTEIALEAREIAVQHYGWPALARLQTELWRSISGR